MTIGKRILVALGLSVLGLCTLFIVAWFMPFPIEGNWDAGNGWGIRGFTRFENGKILGITESLPPPYWLGTYKKKGLGKYEIEFLFGFQTNTVVFYSTFLRINVNNRWCNVIPTQETDTSHEGSGVAYNRHALFTRNFSILDCWKILNAPENEWIEIPREFYRRVLGTADERLFAWGDRIFTREQTEAFLNELLKQPVPIYTASNEVPECVMDTLTQNGFDYQVHANQQWITDEWRSYWKNPDASPLWTNHNPKIIIRLPSDSGKEEDPKIYSWRGGGYTFEYLKDEIERHQKNRDTVKNDFYLYVKDGILPEDVRQMFDELGINYHVRDEKILYRGKQKK